MVRATNPTRLRIKTIIIYDLNCISHELFWLWETCLHACSLHITLPLRQFSRLTPQSQFKVRKSEPSIDDSFCLISTFLDVATAAKKLQAFCLHSSILHRSCSPSHRVVQLLSSLNVRRHDDHLPCWIALWYLG